MGTVILNFVGVNAYVPHTDGDKLLVVMPNASKLGSSPPAALDGTLLSQHLPFLWEWQEEAGARWSVKYPRIFVGARLNFSFDGHPSGLDLQGIQPQINSGWLDVDSSLLSAAPDHRVAAQVVVHHGTVTEYSSSATPCNKTWIGPGNLAMNAVVAGLRVEIRDVDRVEATTSPWVQAGPKQIYAKDLPGSSDEVELFVGNQCATDALDWPRNASKLFGRTEDTDFKWVFGLSQDPAIHGLRPLPIPEVNGSSIDATDTPGEAFGEFWGGGGAAGCECNGCIDKPGSFS